MEDKDARFPCFQLCAQDWDGGKVRLVSCEAQGAYVRLLTFMWLHSQDQSSVEAHDEALAQITELALPRWREIRAELLHAHTGLLTQSKTPDGKRLHSAVLSTEVERQRARRASFRSRGRSGGQARWGEPSPAGIKEKPPKARSAVPKEKKPMSVKKAEGQDLATLRFQALKAAYPLKNGKLIGAAKAKDRFMALSEANQILCVAAAPNYAVCEKVRNGYIKEFYCWVTDHSGGGVTYHWQDWDHPESAPAFRGQNKHGPSGGEEWLRRRKAERAAAAQHEVDITPADAGITRTQGVPS